MALIQSRSTVASIKKETTENTPVQPAATTDFIAVQDDLSFSPDRETLENAELKSSLAPSKPILGSDNPTAEFSHYLRASGVVAQAPNYGALLEAAFGATATAGAEYNTVASSTTSVIKVDTGEGASYQRGEALLIKDSTNGYRIRCIDSISTDDLSIGFQVPTAPGTGVNLGRAVLYYPANSGHPSLTAWGYMGNAGCVQMISGARVTNVDIQANAGELVNASFSLEGLRYFFNPIYVASTDAYIDWTDDDDTFAASIPTGWYNGPHELAAAIESAMNDQTTETVSVDYLDASGKFKFSCTGTVLSLLWQSGSNTANTIGNLIGFTVSADDSGTAATTGYTADNAMSWAAAYTPAYDSADPLVAKYHEVMIGTASDYSCFEASSIAIAISTPRTVKESICAQTGISGSEISGRQVTVSGSALLSQHDARVWEAYRAGSEYKFQYSFGEKLAGNWVAGKCGAVYCPTMTLTSFNLSDADGLVQLDFELTGYTAGLGEVFVNFL